MAQAGDRLTLVLRRNGAAEVHFRVGSPPITHPCFYGIDTPSRRELIGALVIMPELAIYAQGTARVVGIEALQVSVWVQYTSRGLDAGLGRNEELLVEDDRPGLAASLERAPGAGVIDEEHASLGAEALVRRWRADGAVVTATAVPR